MHHIIVIFGILLILIILFGWSYPHLIKPYFVKLTLQNRARKIASTQTLEHLLESLYSETNAHNVSNLEREQMKITSDEFTYGEIVFLSFIEILERLHVKPGDVFYDLGSGSGKAVMTAALHYDLAKACGVELLPGLYELEKQKIGQLRNLVQWHEKKTRNMYEHRIDRIHFINDNILKTDISDATVVFINATCFSSATWDALIDRLTRLRIGTKVFATTKSIKDDHFQLLFQEKYLMSWGMATITAYEKVK